MAAGTIAAGKIAVDKIADRILAEDAAADSGAVVDAVAVAVLPVRLLAGAICRHRNMQRHRVPAKRAGRNVAMIGVTIEETIEAGRGRIAEDRIAGSNRVDLRIAVRKILGMARVLR